MKKYNLITHSDVNFWSRTNVNLLVGDWCLVGLDKKKYLKLKYKIIPYHWNNKKKK